jgi:UDP-galactopyranose mutase
MKWEGGNEIYDPVNNKKNKFIYGRYKKKAKEKTNTHFGGRLAEYKYYDMHQVIDNALKLADRIIV